MLHGHGGDIYSLARDLGIAPGSILDFSSNVSPLPLPEGLQEVLTGHLQEIRSLPELDSVGVREALARRYRLSARHFLVGGGTTEWIYSIPRVFGHRKVCVPLPTYADYADAARLAQCPVETLGPWPDTDPHSDGDILDNLRRAARDQSIIFLCNPNNPTGRFISPQALRSVISSDRDSVWVIDEAYAPFVGPDSRSSLITTDFPPNLIVLRSFSKIYGVPGLRLGYAVGDPERISALAVGARPWAVSRLAQLAGEFLVNVEPYEQRVRDYCRQERSRFLSAIKGIHLLDPVEGACPFILFRVRKPWTAGGIATKLRNHGILIRDCGNFVGLGGEFIRISLRAKGDNDTLVRILEASMP
jgi:threonine-phosphate decarboxylase